MKILIVEDEREIALPIKRLLENRGFAVDFCEDGQSAIESAMRNDYDCIILDLNLPKKDGISVAKELREDGINVPILMLTARSQTFNKLEGFDSGADDYVTKPFSMKELLARINALIKRNSINKTHTLKIQELELIPDQNLAVKNVNKKTKSEIQLSNKETALFEYLLRNKNKIVSTEELLEHVWDSEIDLFTDTVKTHIKTLRKKVDPDKKIITTIRGKGYKISS